MNFLLPIYIWPIFHLLTQKVSSAGGSSGQATSSEQRASGMAVPSSPGRLGFGKGAARAQQGVGEGARQESPGGGGSNSQHKTDGVAVVPVPCCETVGMFFASIFAESA